MDLADLKKSVSEMSDEELLALLAEIRSRRKTPVTKKAKAPATIDVTALLGGMSAGDLEELADALEGLVGGDE